MKNIKCKHCNNLRNDWCEKVVDSPDEELLRDCQHFWERTNADRIRAMSDEELAAWMAECNAYGERADAGQWLPWLKEPAEDER